MRCPFDITGTIGSLPCERSLNKILADRADPKLIKKITKLLQLTRGRLKQLKLLTDKPTYFHFRSMLKRDVEKAVEGITGSKVRGVPVNDALASHTMCCLHAYFSSDFHGRELKDAVAG